MKVKAEEEVKGDSSPSLRTGSPRPIKMNVSGLTDFEREVLKKVMEIPKGKVATYGDVARAIGRENAARAAGNALAKNPFPIKIPCHRVIKSDLTLGGYTGGVDKKIRLLEEEGVVIVNGKVKKEHLFKF